MDKAWLDILSQNVAQKGASQVARELGLSTTTISLVSNGKYKASTANIESRVSKIYGTDGGVDCPEQGIIDPEKCATTWDRAHKIGLRCGNPRTIRLYQRCKSCEVRSG